MANEPDVVRGICDPAEAKNEAKKESSVWEKADSSIQNLPPEYLGYSCSHLFFSPSSQSQGWRNVSWITLMIPNSGIEPENKSSIKNQGFTKQGTACKQPPNKID